MVPTGVGTALVTEDDEHPRARIEFTKVLPLSASYVLAHELGGVVAGVASEESCVVGDVVDAVRDDCPVGECFGIVVFGLRFVTTYFFNVT